jgi:plastocyanin
MSRLVVAVLTVAAVSGTMLYASSHVVKQKMRLFSPGALSVSAGDTVVFKNDDTVTHHIYSATRGSEFELETTEPSEDVRHTFAKRGRVEIRCGLHPGMRMIVTVK